MGSKDLVLFAVLLLFSSFELINGGEEQPCAGVQLVTKESRRVLVSTEAGNITTVDVHDENRGTYHLEFITMAPRSLLLPVLLHTDMVLYVHDGNGRIAYSREDEHDKIEYIEVECGDIYSLEKGSIFYMQSSSASPTAERLSVHAIFNLVYEENNKDLPAGAYSSIGDLVRNFGEEVLQKGFGVSEETIQAIKMAENPPSIVPFSQGKEMRTNWGEVFATLRGLGSPIDGNILNKNKKRAFNFYQAKPDVVNCNGWSTELTHKDLKAMDGARFGAFMVNLSSSSMMGPHWNPSAAEVDIIIQGQGVVQVVCPSMPSGESNETLKGQETTFRVGEGDVLMVPKHHPMTQMSYNDGRLVFVGLSSHTGKKRQQFLAGKRSVLQSIDREILAMSLNVPKATVDDLLGVQDDLVMLECISCAERLEHREEEGRGAEEKETRGKEAEEEEEIEAWKGEAERMERVIE